MNSYLEGLPSIVGNLGSPVTILNEFVLEAKEIEGGTRLVITSLSSGEVQTVDIMNAHTPEKGIDYWTESDKQELVRAAAAAIPLDDTLLQNGKAADAGAVGAALDAFEERMEERIPESVSANQILVTDESGNPRWEERTHYSVYAQETVFEEYTVDGQSGAWIRDQSLLTDVVAGSEYTVTYNGTEYNLIAYNDVNFGPSLGNVSILGSGEDTGEPFYFGNLSRAIPQILAYFTTDGPHVFSIKGTAEKVTPLPGKYVGGGVYPGVGLYATTIGTKSAYASGQGSVALNNAIAQGENALAEGFGHAEGDYSHSEGAWTYSMGAYSHAEGLHTRAESPSQHVQGKYNVTDAEDKYAHIVGNGKGTNSRANAHTLDWAGNAWFAGKIYSGGTGHDDGAAAEVALKTDIPDAIVTPESAIVGQAIVVKATDEAGKPTSWAAETMVKSINGVEPDEKGDIATTAILPEKILKTVSNMDVEEDGTVVSNPTRCFSIIDGSNLGVPLNNYNLYTAKDLNDSTALGFVDTKFTRSVMTDDGMVSYTCTKVEVVSSSIRKYHFDDRLAPILVDSTNNTITLDPDWGAPKDPPVPTASHQMLVTDDSGHEVWENRTHWSEYQQVSLVKETLIKQELFPGMFIYQTQYMPKYPIEIGAKCAVELNGTTYECVVQEYGEGGPPCLGNRYLQNKSAFEDTGEPFFFNTLEPGSIVVAVFDTSITVPETVRITGPVQTYIQIPPQYIAGIKEGEAMGAVVLGGDSNTATGTAACAEGVYTDARGYAAHSEGMATAAAGAYSHAEGQSTVAKGSSQHVQGRYNIQDAEGKYAHIVGNGGSAYGETTYSNAHTLDWSGNAWFSGAVYVGGSGQDDSENVKKLVTRDEVIALIEEKLGTLAAENT